MTKAPTFFDPRPILSDDVAASETGRLITAASVAMVLLRKAKVATIAELALAPERIPASLRVEKEIVADIEAFGDVLAGLYVPVTGVKGGPSQRYLVVCTGCGRWMLLSAGAPPAKCNLTLGCPGKPTKASAAVTRKAPQSLEAHDPNDEHDDVEDDDLPEGPDSHEELS